jgi:hypothetical protein
MYAIERTARENELARLKESVAALKGEQTRLEGQSALTQGEPIQPVEAQPAAKEEALPAPAPVREQDQLLDQQLSELSELFKSPTQLIAPKPRGKKGKKENS